MSTCHAGSKYTLYLAIHLHIAVVRTTECERRLPQHRDLAPYHLDALADEPIRCIRALALDVDCSHPSADFHTYTKIRDGVRENLTQEVVPHTCELTAPVELGMAEDFAGHRLPSARMLVHGDSLRSRVYPYHSRGEASCELLGQLGRDGLRRVEGNVGQEPVRCRS
jgi:hypothetical protein